MDTPEDSRSIHLPIPQGGTTREVSRAPLPTGDVGGAGNLEKIRDILVGNQMRDADRKLLRLEERLLKEYTDLKEDHYASIPCPT